jgi:hypothetical protein
VREFQSINALPLYFKNFLLREFFLDTFVLLAVGAKVFLAYLDKKIKTIKAKTSRPITKISVALFAVGRATVVSVGAGVGNVISAGALYKNVKEPVIGESSSAISV